jgi:hypothetical protein
METTVRFGISLTGLQTGRPYAGDFTVKTVLSKKDQFRADEIRRILLGVNSESALPALQGDAFMMGQLAVRIVDGPEWWKKSNNGADLEDDNVIPTLFELCMDKEKEHKEKLKAAAEEALKILAEKK